MITEGIAREISPEIIRSIATLVPILLSGWWMLLILGSLWRTSIWNDVGGAIERLAASTGGVIRPRWSGWTVDAGAIRIDWVGGLLGPRTIVKTAQKTEEHPKFLTSGELSELSDLHR